MTRWLRHPVAPGIALAALALLQPWLEQRMALHMAVELPLLFAVGWWVATLQGGMPAWWRTLDVAGLPGFTAATAVTGFWMLPLALDAAVLSPVVGWTKVASLVAAGWLARQAFAHAHVAVQGFFVLGWVWMTGMAGVLYQEAPARLCSTYLQGDQAWAGLGLVMVAIGVAVAWMLVAFRQKETPAGGGSG